MKKAVTSSNILTTIKTTLKELDTAMDTGSEGIELTPFTKKIRDLNKGMTIYYNDSHDSFAMEYHGMGTRSWSSLLTLKSFISLLAQNIKKEKSILFPVLAIEEPEAHLHPNAQKKLFWTDRCHLRSKNHFHPFPYIAATASLNQIRSFYKNERVVCGRIDTKQLQKEEIRKINRQVIHTRGEIFFSKLIIFCEGETEEQALPVFAEKYFGKTAMEMGLNFVGVGSFSKYLPFLYFAEAFNIPWLIFSDAENTPNKMVKENVQKQFSKCGSLKNERDCIVFLDEGNDFEKQLIDDGFEDEVKAAIAYFDEYNNAHHRTAKEPERLREIKAYSDDELYKIITNAKTQYGPVIAEQIISSGKALPPKIIKLFEKITAILRWRARDMRAEVELSDQTESNCICRKWADLCKSRC